MGEGLLNAKFAVKYTFVVLIVAHLLKYVYKGAFEKWHFIYIFSWQKSDS